MRFGIVRIFTLVLFLSGCQQDNPLKNVRDEVVKLQGTAWFNGSALGGHTVRLYPYSASGAGSVRASTTTNASGTFNIDLGLDDGAYLVEIANPILNNVVLRSYVYAFPDDKTEFGPVHLHILSQWQGAYYKYLIDQHRDPIEAHTQASMNFVKYVGFDPQRTYPSDKNVDKSTGMQLRAYLESISVLGNMLATRARVASSFYSVDAIRDALARDIAADGVADGKEGTQEITINNIAIPSDLLRTEMARSLHRWLGSIANTLGLTQSSEASLIDRMATMSGGAFVVATETFDVRPPVLALKDIYPGDLVWPSLAVLCEATDQSRVTEMSVFFEYENKQYAVQEVVPGTQDGIERRRMMLNADAIRQGDMDATLVCVATDIFEQTSTLRVPVHYNGTYGEITFGQVPSGIPEIARITCECPDEETSCEIIAGPQGKPVPAGSSDDYVARIDEDKHLICDTRLPHKHSCLWSTGHLPTDDVVNGFVCKISSPGFDDAQKSTTVSPDLYADGSVTVQAHIGFPIVGGMARAYQIMNDGRRGRRIDACAVDSGCITDSTGRAVLRLRDINTVNETYSGVIELFIDGGTTQSISDIAKPKSYISTPAYRTWIAYSPKKRSVQSTGVDLGTVVVNAETSLAASFADGFKHNEPGTSLSQSVIRAHALLAQRLSSCTCLFENKVTHEPILPHPYNDPSGACYVDLSTINASSDIRRVLPSSLGDVSKLRDSFADRLALLHVGYQLRANFYDLGSSFDVRVKLNDYVWSLGLDALDGVWNGKNYDAAVGVGNGILLQPKEHRSLLVSRLIDWLNEQAHLDIAGYSQPITGFLPSLMQCSNALFDSTDVADVYDWRDPHVTLERTDGSGTLQSATLAVRVNTSDDDTRVETLEFSVQQANAKGAPDSALGVSSVLKQVVLPKSTDAYALTLPTCAGRTKLVATVRDSANRMSTATLANIVCDNVAPIFTGFVETTFQDHASGTVSFNAAGAYVHAESTTATVNPSTLLTDTGLRFTTYVDLAGDPLHVPHLLISNQDQDTEPVVVEYAFTPNGMTSSPLGWQTARLMTGPDISRAEIMLTVEALCSKNVLCQEGLIKRLGTDQFHTLKIRMRDTTGNSSAEKIVRVFSTYRFPPVRVVETKWASMFSRIGNDALVDTLFDIGNLTFAPFVENVVDFPIPASSGWLPSVVALTATNANANFDIRFNKYSMGSTFLSIEGNRVGWSCAGTPTAAMTYSTYWQYLNGDNSPWQSMGCVTTPPHQLFVTVNGSTGYPDDIITGYGTFLSPAYYQSNGDTPREYDAVLLPGQSRFSMGWMGILIYGRSAYPDMQFTYGSYGPKIGVPSHNGPKKVRQLVYDGKTQVWNVRTYSLDVHLAQMTVRNQGSDKNVGVDIEHRIQGQINVYPDVIYDAGASKVNADLVIQ